MGEGVDRGCMSVGSSDGLLNSWFLCGDGGRDVDGGWTPIHWQRDCDPASLVCIITPSQKLGSYN